MARPKKPIWTPPTLRHFASADEVETAYAHIPGEAKVELLKMLKRAREKCSREKASLSETESELKAAIEETALSN